MAYSVFGWSARLNARRALVPPGDRNTTTTMSRPVATQAAAIEEPS
ncbi:MAG TPA: hypothetical protein VGU71_21175 [Candidatus Dormibacteraeota bacterium]|nr:hypothetical protein [Candidatus Dormibacteraeota bacterium]